MGGPLLGLSVDFSAALYPDPDLPALVPPDCPERQGAIRTPEPFGPIRGLSVGTETAPKATPASSTRLPEASAGLADLAIAVLKANRDRAREGMRALRARRKAQTPDAAR